MDHETKHDMHSNDLEEVKLTTVFIRNDWKCFSESEAFESIRNDSRIEQFSNRLEVILE